MDASCHRHNWVSNWPLVINWVFVPTPFHGHLEGRGWAFQSSNKWLLFLEGRPNSEAIQKPTKFTSLELIRESTHLPHLQNCKEHWIRNQGQRSYIVLWYQSKLVWHSVQKEHHIVTKLWPGISKGVWFAFMGVQCIWRSRADIMSLPWLVLRHCLLLNPELINSDQYH